MFKFSPFRYIGASFLIWLAIIWESYGQRLCPRYWEKFEDSCYQFIAAPMTNWSHADTVCKSWGAKLLSVETKREHLFIVKHLTKFDPALKSWYTSGVKNRAQNRWYWLGEEKPFAFDSGWYSEIQKLKRQEDLKTLKLQKMADTSPSISNRLDINYDNRFKRDTNTLEGSVLNVSQSWSGKVARSLSQFPQEAILNRPDPYRLDSSGGAGVLVSWSDRFGDHVIYHYNVPDGTWAWNATDPSTPRAFVCETPPLQSTRGEGRAGRDQLIATDPFEQSDRDYAYGQVEKKGTGRGYWSNGEDVQRPLETRNIEKPVTFTLQPVDITYDKNSRERHVQLICKAEGYPAPRYAWYKDGTTKVDINSNPRLSITNGILDIFEPEAQSDAATYHCSVSNKFGTALSSKARLIFKSIKDFKPDALPIKAYVRMNTIIPCQAPESYPDVRYYWFKDSLPNFVPKDSRIFHSWKGNLYIANVDRSDDGYYICMIKSSTTNMAANRLGKTSSPIPLIVTNTFVNSKRKPVMEVGFPAAFPSNPLLGQEVRIECVAYGDPLPQYNWTRAEAPLPAKARMEDYNRVLIIPNVQPSDNGNYLCKASNGIGQVEHGVQLSTSAAPIFTMPLRDQYVNHGSRVEFVCEAYANPGVQYKWYKDGQPFDASTLVAEVQSAGPGVEARIQFLPDPNDRDKLIRDGYFFEPQIKIVIIKDVSERDNGIYQCEASNAFGTHYSTAHLKVMAFKPVFTRTVVVENNKTIADPPRRDVLVAAENSNTTITCRPQSAPKAKFAWSLHKLAQTFPLSIDGRRLVQLNGGDLLIRNLRHSDTGVYTCRASNYLGSASISTNLKVVDVSRITRQPISISSGPYANLSIECHASAQSELDLAFVWTFNDVHIDLHKPYFAQRYIIDFMDRDKSKLTIVSGTRFQTGKYRCYAQTSVDTAVSEPALVMIAGVPSAPSAVSASELTTNMAKLRWTNGGDNGSPVTGYIIQGQTAYRDWFTLTQILATGAKSVGQVRNQIYSSYEYIEDSLLPYNSYQFRIAAINEYGTGDFSTGSASYTMRSDRPHVIPRNLGGGGGMVGDLVITWDALMPDEYGGSGLSYEVFWLKKEDWERSDKKGKFEKKLISDSTKTSYVTRVGKDNFYSPYVVKIRAVNSMGEGPESRLVTIMSAEDVPTKEPTLVQAFPHNSTALEVRWKGLDPGRRDIIRGILLGYKIQYGLEHDLTPNDRRTRILYGALDEGLVIGLRPNTRYWVKVMAFNSAGNGPLSDPVYMHTFRDAPLMQPTDVAVNGPTRYGAVRISWNGVYTTNNEEPLEGYKIRIWEGREDISQYQDTPVGLVNYHDIYNFPQHKVYKIRVLGYSRGGDGKMSQALEVCIKCDNLERQDHLERLSLEYAERLDKPTYRVYQISSTTSTKHFSAIYYLFSIIFITLFTTHF